MIYKILNLNYVYGRLNYCHCRSLSSLNLWNEELSASIKLKIEERWNAQVNKYKFDENDTDKKKFYALSMFPYPSGNLHMGHVRVYTISDAIARFHRMNGKNVLQPIGWDAFGLPAENAAIDHKIPPEEWTKSNIAQMKAQLKQLACSFDWDRELSTCNPQYYRWTQELFLELFRKGLVYQKESLVNWDPVDQTVLADEQVDENGCSWRSGAKVEKKSLNQWFVKTTAFAKDLNDSLDQSELIDWRDIIKLQKHWIGDCNGVTFEFKLHGDGNLYKPVTLWTNYPEFIQNAAFVAISGSNNLAKLDGAVLDETGTKWLNAELENPLNGTKLPVYVTNEIEFLPDTDTFIGIPGVCEQSRNFADKYFIPYNELPELTAREKVALQEEICKKSIALNVGGYWSSAKLRDWLISRQRYWGTPIPIIHCENCGTQPVPKQQLPVTLPKLSNLTRKGLSPLLDCTDWINTNCPKCNGKATRETDTMDTFVDSSWYYLRYLDPHNSSEMFNTEKTKKLMPVDLYIGGKEHAVLHLYYARFISHFLYSLGMLPQKEPFKRLLVQGMVMGRSFRIKGTGKYVPENEVKITNLKRNQAVLLKTNEPVVVSWEKMSKSKHNGVNPEDMFAEYGTDTTRLLVLADVAPTSHRNWNSNTFPGIMNWQKRLWLTIKDFITHRTSPPKLVLDEKFKSQDNYMYDSRNFYIKGATFNYSITQQLSVAVSKQQGLTNSLRKVPPEIICHSLQFERALASQIILLAPMAPHFASELWSGFVSAPNRLNSSDEILWDKGVCDQKWPEVDLDYELELVCQTNGFERCTVKIPRRVIDSMKKGEALDIALKQTEIQNVLSDRTVLDSKFVVHKGCEGVINILSSPPKTSRKKQEAEG